MGRAGTQLVAHQQPELGDQYAAHAGGSDKENVARQTAQARPAYCPSRYEDDEALSDPASERVTAVRTRMKALQCRAVPRVVSSPSFGLAEKNDAGLVHTQVPATSSTAPAKPLLPVADASDGVPASMPMQERPKPAGHATAVSQQPVVQQQDKLSSILSFLDTVEEASRNDASSLLSSAQSSRHPQEGTAGLPGPHIEDSLVRESSAALQSRVALLEAEVLDKKKIVITLRETLSEAKSRAKQAVEAAGKERDLRLQQQKDHYEASLERQLKLVDRLLNDKNELTKRCELFTEELKAVERRFQTKIEELDEQASKELARQKQNWTTAERMRREAWEKDKVKEIKEMTIKGLQPEVERILAERKQDRLKLDAQHKEALDALRKDMQDAAQQQVREARDVLTQAHEEALDREREAHRKRLKDEFDRFSAQLQEERAKCAADLLAECRKHEQQLQQEVEHNDGAVREAVAAERKRADEALAAAKEELRRVEEQHRADLSRLEEHKRSLQDEWEQKHMERARQEQEALREQLMKDLEAERAELVKERDMQLDLLVDRLSREHVEQQRALKEESASLAAAARQDAEAAAEKLAAELRETRQQVKAVEAQLLSSQEAVSALRGQLEMERASKDDLQARLENWDADRAQELRKRDSTVAHERAELQAERRAQEEMVEALQAELEDAHTQVAAEKARCEEQRQEQKTREERLIDGLETRVKRALQAKDEQLSDMKSRCTAAENKVREFEYLLARQREELLSGIAKDVLTTPR